MLNGLDLFTGIGGMSLALSEWVRPIAYCEIDPYCQGILLSRISNGSLHKPINGIWDDIRTLKADLFLSPIDIIYGGFPCQGISVAGLGKGLADERSGLFFEIVRLSKEIKPAFIFLENVPAITTRGGLRVVREIAEMGYDCRFCIISAASIGALHRRERWFLLAHSNCNGSSSSKRGGSTRECASQGQESQEQKESIRKAQRAGSIPSDVADTNSKRLEGFRDGEISSREKESQFTSSSPNVADTRYRNTRREDQSERTPLNTSGCSGFWEVEPAICRMVDGVSNRVDRIKSLGNSVVSLQAKEAFEILMGLK